jgi:hypothetical protein
MATLHNVMNSADTTRFALFNTWALLAQLPAVQDKIYEEQKAVRDAGRGYMQYGTSLCILKWVARTRALMARYDWGVVMRPGGLWGQHWLLTLSVTS